MNPYKGLKILYNSILSHFNTTALADQPFPSYCDLMEIFDVQENLCPTNLYPADIQIIANSKLLDQILCPFLLASKAIPSATFPSLTSRFFSL